MKERFDYFKTYLYILNNGTKQDMEKYKEYLQSMEERDFLIFANKYCKEFDIPYVIKEYDVETDEEIIYDD